MADNIKAFTGNMPKLKIRPDVDVKWAEQHLRFFGKFKDQVLDARKRTHVTRE